MSEVEANETVREGQTRQTDLDALKDRLVAGEKLGDIAQKEPQMYCKYKRTLHRLEDYVNRSVKRTEMTDAFWLWGPTGTGKSQLAFTTQAGSIYAKKSTWWTDYTGQELVVLDDYKAHLTWQTLMQLADRYSFEVPRRRSPYPFTSKAIIITSRRSPEKMYHKLASEFDRLYRRFRVFEFKKDGHVVRTLPHNPREAEALTSHVGHTIMAALQARMNCVTPIHNIQQPVKQPVKQPEKQLEKQLEKQRVFLAEPSKLAVK